jgi:hypothetical protein
MTRRSRYAWSLIFTLGETERLIAKGPGVREVWEYDGKRFLPLAVHAGMADADGRSW